MCVREVTTVGNKHILSLCTVSIVFPVQKTVFPGDTAGRLISFCKFLWLRRIGGMGGGKLQGELHNLWDVSFLLCLPPTFSAVHGSLRAALWVAARQLRPRPGAISQLHQLEFTIRWQSTNAFLRCGLRVAGEGCVSGPLVSEPAGLNRSGANYRGLPEDFPKVSYRLNHITMTFSGSNLILSANPGYQAFHRSLRSNTVGVWLQYLSLL